MSFELTERYIKAKYNNVSKTELIALRNDAANALTEIKSAKSEIYANGPHIHGRFQQSQLDVLDIQESKICAIFDNVSEMINSRA